MALLLPSALFVTSVLAGTSVTGSGTIASNSKTGIYTNTTGQLPTICVGPPNISPLPSWYTLPSNVATTCSAACTLASSVEASFSILAPSSSAAALSADVNSSLPASASAGVLRRTARAADLPEITEPPQTIGKRHGPKGRAHNTLTGFGPRGKSCLLTSSVANGAPAATTPSYTGGFTIMFDDAAGKLPNSLQSITRWVTTVCNGNAPPTVTTIGVAAFQAAFQAGGELFAPSTDHSYELHWLKDFFDSIISTKGGTKMLDCAQMDLAFFVSGKDVNRLRAVFNALPGGEDSNGHPYPMTDFTMMNTEFNNWKSYISLHQVAKGFLRNGGGALLNHRSTWDDADSLISKRLQALEQFYVGASLMNYAAINSGIVATNERIYKALQSLDREVGCIKGFPTGFKFATAYKDFMNDLYNDQPGSIQSLIRDKLQTIVERTNKDLVTVSNMQGLSQDQQKKLKEWWDKYNLLYVSDPAKPDTYDYVPDINWWGFLSTRDLEDDDSTSCNVTSPSGTASSFITSRVHLSTGTASPATTSYRPDTYACKFYGGPETTMSNECTCINGATIEGTNNTSGNYCPWTTLPLAALAWQASVQALPTPTD